MFSGWGGGGESELWTNGLINLQQKTQKNSLTTENSQIDIWNRGQHPKAVAWA